MAKKLKPQNIKTRQSASEKSPDALVSLLDISKRYIKGSSRIDILSNMNFSLKIAETVAIIGASGIGKSTLLHILGTLDRPDSGTMLFKGENVFLFNDQQLARFRNESIGFVFQFHHLLAEFTALENVMMPALIKGIDKTRAAREAKNFLIRVGLGKRLTHRAVELSGGEQQRVALARALVLKPDILLADEPTGNLDKKNSDQIHHLLLELNVEMGMTLIVVTHNMDLARHMSRCVTITDGQLEEYSL